MKGKKLDELINDFQSYKFIAPGYRTRVKRAIANLDVKKEERILDVGCGRGENVCLVSALGASVVGIDIDINSVSAAKKMCLSISSKASFIIADAQNLPFKDKVFTKACSIHSLEHIKNDVKAVKEMNRVLKEGGIVALDVPCLKPLFFRDPINFILYKAGKEQLKFLGGWRWGHIRQYRLNEISSLAKKGGFEIIELSTTMYEIIGLVHNYLPEVFNFVVLPTFKKFKSLVAKENLKKSNYKKEKPSKITKLIFIVLYKISESICMLDKKIKIGSGGGSYSLLLRKI